MMSTATAKKSQLNELDELHNIFRITIQEEEIKDFVVEVGIVVAGSSAVGSEVYFAYLRFHIKATEIGLFLVLPPLQKQIHRVHSA